MHVSNCSSALLDFIVYPRDVTLGHVYHVNVMDTREVVIQIRACVTIVSTTLLVNIVNFAVRAFMAMRKVAAHMLVFLVLVLILRQPIILLSAVRSVSFILNLSLHSCVYQIKFDIVFVGFVKQLFAVLSQPSIYFFMCR